MHIARKTLIACAALAAACVTQARADDKPAPKNECFFINQFESWKAPDAKTIYIRTTMNRFYRLDLANTCSELTWPDSHLITQVRGPDTVCTALDWDLRVSNGLHDIPQPCLVKTMTQLTPDEVAAIPKKFKP